MPKMSVLDLRALLNAERTDAMSAITASKLAEQRATALDYYQGYQYSETVEVAVVLCRLGYRVRNDQLVPVPVFRSRTSMRDALIDLLVMPRASWRVWRRKARGTRPSWTTTPSGRGDPQQRV